MLYSVSWLIEVTAMHLLLIEDDIDFGQALQKSLKVEGFTVVWVRRLADGVAIQDELFDAVILDLTLPDGEGLDQLRHWREAHIEIPVVIITARSDLQNRLAGLDGGADDYLVKPFATAELVSRLWAVNRRYARHSSQSWALGELEVAPREHKAWLHGDPLDLSAREFRLLVELVREPGTVVSKSVLGQRLDPLGDPVDPATIEVHLSNLRRKVGADRIRTVRGVGYQWIV
jgi:two-component system response regulator BasR